MKQASCVSCGFVITNPVCVHCLADEVEQWLLVNDPSLIPYIRHIEESISTTGDEATTCILCGRKMGVCSYCFTKEILEMLQNSYPVLVESFLVHFGFGGHSLDPPDEFMAM